MLMSKFESQKRILKKHLELIKPLFVVVKQRFSPVAKDLSDVMWPGKPGVYHPMNNRVDRRLIP